MTSRHANWMVVVFLAIIIGLVFQQIHTSMVKQGIASGGPYDNAAAYPRAIAILIGIMLVAQGVGMWSQRRAKSAPGDTALVSELVRPALLIVIFGLYLFGLSTLGYHLSTTPMLVAVMLLCGVRKPHLLVAVSLGISFVFAFLFEFFLTIVLPGGYFGLNIPW